MIAVGTFMDTNTLKLKCPHCGGMMLKKVGQTNIKFYCQNCNYTKYAPKEENNSEEQTEEVKE